MSSLMGVVASEAAFGWWRSCVSEFVDTGECSGDYLRGGLLAMSEHES